MMNLNQLKYVLAVHQHASFTAAANVCCVTQPSLSNAISTLEEELGGQLFQRTTRQVRLSEFGKEMLPLINNIIEAETQLLNNAKSTLIAEKQTLKLGLSPLVSSYLSAAIMASFKHHFPKHKLLLIEDNLQDLRRALRSGALDLIVVPETNEKLDDCYTQAITNECLLFLDNKKKQMSSISLEEIEGKTIIMVPDACGLATITRELFNGKTFNQYEGSAMSYQMLENWALQGLGIAIIPESKVAQSKQLAIPITQDNNTVTITFSVYWKKQLLDGFKRWVNNLSIQLAN